MYLYHRTDAAEAIGSQGFRNGSGGYMTASDYEGVWVSDRPLDINEGANGKYVITIGLPSDFDLRPYEWLEDGKGYREFLIPAEVLNGFLILAVDEDDIDGFDPDELADDQPTINIERLSRDELEVIRKAPPG